MKWASSRAGSIRWIGVSLADPAVRLETVGLYHVSPKNWLHCDWALNRRWAAANGGRRQPECRRAAQRLFAHRRFYGAGLAGRTAIAFVAALVANRHRRITAVAVHSPANAAFGPGRSGAVVDHAAETSRRRCAWI